MDGRDAEILCGEWQTRSASPSTSGEEYNVVLPILQIVRHPDFDSGEEGPAGGSDITVFKVPDTQLKERKDHIIWFRK